METDKKIFWLIGTIFQLVLIVAAQLFALFFQKKNLLATLIPDNIVYSVGMGLITGISLFIAVYLSYRYIPLLRNWSRRVVLPLLKNMDLRFLMTMGILAGLSEELFFRGALQPVVGIGLASLLFGFVHYLGNKELLFYGIIAAGMGFVMGIALILSGEILVPVVAHSVYNFSIITAVAKGVFE